MLSCWCAVCLVFILLLDTNFDSILQCAVCLVFLLLLDTNFGVILLVWTMRSMSFFSSYLLSCWCDRMIFDMCIKKKIILTNLCNRMIFDMCKKKKKSYKQTYVTLIFISLVHPWQSLHFHTSFGGCDQISKSLRCWKGQTASNILSLWHKFCIG